MIYVDLETRRGPILDERWSAEIPPPPLPGDLVPPKNYTRPETIEAWRQQRHAELVAERDQALRERWESTSLEPLEGEILCVGIAVDDRDPVVLWEPTEAATLGRLQAGLAKYSDHPLCAYNGINFDFRWLFARALRHRLHSLAGRAYQPRPYGGSRMHIDPYVVWCGPDRRARGKLEDLARHLGIEMTQTLCGTQVPRLWHEHGTPGDPRRDEARARISAHVVEDIRVLRLVHREFEAAGVCA